MAPLKNTNEDDSNKFNDQIKAVLESIKIPTIIFIDALDQLLHRDYLMWLPNELPDGVKIVLSVLNDIDFESDSHYFKILEGRVEESNLYNLNLDRITDATKLITTYLELEKRTLTEDQITYLSQKFESSDHSPLWMKIALEEAKQWHSWQKAYKVEIGIKPTINKFIENLHDYYHHQPLLIEKVLGYVHTSKDGLSEKELLDVLSEDLHDDIEFQKQILNEFHTPIKIINPRRNNQKELKFPLAHWSRLHVQLKPFLVTTNIDGQPLMKFFHRQFATVIEERSKEIEQKFHKKLADYFLSLQDREKSWDQRYFNLRMLEETPYQLFKAKKEHQLKSLLFDLEFAGSVYDHHKHYSYKKIVSKQHEKDEDYKNLHQFLTAHTCDLLDWSNNSWKKHKVMFQLLLEYEEFDKITSEFITSNRINWTYLKRVDKKLLPSILFKDTFIDKSFLSEIKGVSGSLFTFIVWSRNKIRLYNKSFEVLQEYRIDTFDIKYAVYVDNVVIVLLENSYFLVLDSCLAIKNIFYISTNMEIVASDISSIETFNQMSDYHPINWVVVSKENNILLGLEHSRKTLSKFDVDQLIELNIKNFRLKKVPEYNSKPLINSGLLVFKDGIHNLKKKIGNNVYPYGSKLFEIDGNVFKSDLNQFSIHILSNDNLRDDSMIYRDEYVYSKLINSNKVLIWNLNGEFQLIDENIITVKGKNSLLESINENNIYLTHHKDIVIWNSKKLVIFNNDLQKTNEFDIYKVTIVLELDDLLYFLCSDKSIYCWNKSEEDLKKDKMPITLEVDNKDLAVMNIYDKIFREENETLLPFLIFDREGNVLNNGHIRNKQFEELIEGETTFATWDKTETLMIFKKTINTDSKKDFSKNVVSEIKDSMPSRADKLLHLTADEYLSYHNFGNKKMFRQYSTERKLEEFFLVNTPIHFRLIGNENRILYFLDDSKVVRYTL